MNDDEKSRKERAKRLHERIDELTPPTGVRPALPNESPNDFIERRMVEDRKQPKSGKQ